MSADGLVDLQDIHRRLLFHRVFVYADNGLFFAFNSFLILVRRFLYLTLREASLHCFDHSAETVDLVEVIKTSLDHFLCERLEIIAAAKWVDGVRDSGFLGNDLLRSK